MTPDQAAIARLAEFTWPELRGMADAIMTLDHRTPGLAKKAARNLRAIANEIDPHCTRGRQ